MLLSAFDFIPSHNPASNLYAYYCRIESEGMPKIRINSPVRPRASIHAASVEADLRHIVLQFRQAEILVRLFGTDRFDIIRLFSLDIIELIWSAFSPFNMRCGTYSTVLVSLPVCLGHHVHLDGWLLGPGLECVGVVTLVYQPAFVEQLMRPTPTVELVSSSRRRVNFVLRTAMRQTANTLAEKTKKIGQAVWVLAT